MVDCDYNSGGLNLHECIQCISIYLQSGYSEDEINELQRQMQDLKAAMRRVIMNVL